MAHHAVDASTTPGLEPFAARLRWQFPSAIALCEWGALLGECLETLARRCDETGPHVVGHIKGLALLADGAYVRVSVVSPRHPADVEVGGSL